ncbi:hypothetical protein ACPFMM_003466 [Vibrio cholerae]
MLCVASPLGGRYVFLRFIVHPDIDRVMALGQYIHWSRLQYDSFRHAADNDKPNAEFVGRLAHWLASLQVVIEGWYELKCSDARIDRILGCYEEYHDILRRCRNAVYHYQKSQFDKRIEIAMAQEELKEWALVLQDEFECYLYMYPYKTFGLCRETYELHEEFLGCIGWVPSNEQVEMQKLYLLCINYVRQNELNVLEKTHDNDVKIILAWEQLKQLRDKVVEAALTRWNKNT